MIDGTVVFCECYKTGELGFHQNKIKELNGKMKNRACEMAIDVNGFKKPNKVGRDIFWFNMDNQGMLFPTGSKDFSIWFKGDETYMWSSTNPNISCLTNMLKDGDTCAARIMEEGWKMNY